MEVSVEIAAKIVYGMLGSLFLVLGVIALVAPAAALPPEGHSPLVAHLVREQGAHAVFLGLMSFWCLRHLSQRVFVHYALLAFAALFSAIHWSEFLNGNRSLLSPILNTLPFLALTLTAP